MTITDGVNTATAFTVTGLANGTRYYFRVLARNAVGYSPSSNVANAIPRVIPDGGSLADGHAGGDGTDPAGVAGACVQRRLGDHRLRHLPLAERHLGLGDDQ